MQTEDVPADSEALGEQSGLPVSRVLPAYQQVANQLQELIMKGTLVVGERLRPRARWLCSSG